LRIFSHYLSARLLLLIALDVLILAVCVDWSFLPLAADASQRSFPASTSMLLLPKSAFVALMIVVMNGMGLYENEIVQRMRCAIPRLVVATIAGGTIAFVVTLLVVPTAANAYPILGATAAAMLCSAAVRYVFAMWMGSDPLRPRVLVLGSGQGSIRLAELAHRRGNAEMVGHIPCGEAGGEPVPLPRLLPAHGETLLAIADKYGIEQIVVAVKDRRGGTLPVGELLECRLRGVRVSDLSTFFEREHRQVLLDSLTPSWMVYGEGFRQDIVRASVKRLFDVTASLALLALTSPLMLLTALMILAESGRPVLYRQERVGEGGRPFTIFKFRSMRNGAEADGKPKWAGENDQRTTRVGRVIRKTRIDELPQFFNVLRGEMSVVGPRPERPYFVDQLAGCIPYYGLRHTVKPGITGWAQVRYSYGASVEDAIEKLQYDLYYVKNHTLFLDLVILAATVEVVLWGGGSGATPHRKPVASGDALVSAASAEVKQGSRVGLEGELV
jgi:sugar transferase (PEP-CTERM system associated)